MPDDKMRHMLERLGDLRALKGDTEDDIKTTQQGLAELMERDGVKSMTSERYKGTLTNSQRVSIDEDRLKKELGHKVWAKVTTPKLDKDKLEAAIAMELVDPMVVAKCSSTKDITSIRVTAKKGK